MRAVGINGDWQEALALLDEMESAGVAANAVVYNTLISSLAKAEEVRTGVRCRFFLTQA